MNYNYANVKGQSPGLVASSRDDATYRPSRVVESQQFKAMVFGSEQDGNPSQAGSIAKGSQSTLGYGVLKCKNKRCITCTKLNVNKNFLPNVTQKT